MIHTDSVKAWEAESNTFRDIIMKQRDEIERLRTFAHWVIKEGPFNGCNLDGGDVQDKAVELGILTETKYDPAIHGESDSAEPGDPWFMFKEPA